VLTLAFIWSISIPPAAASSKQVVVLLVEGTTFERFMKLPGSRELATTGGAALLSPRTVPGDAGSGHYLTLGTGTRSVGPNIQPRAAVQPLLAENMPLAARLEDLPAYVEANEGLSTPGLLGSLLERRGVHSCAFGTSESLAGEATLVAMDRRGRTNPGPGAGQDMIAGHAFRSCDLLVMRASTHLLTTLGGIGPGFFDSFAPNTLAILLEATPSAAMTRVKDEVTPIIVAEPASRRSASPHTLTSDTTRRIGLVSNEDVAPTILRFFGIPIPAEMNGSPILVVDEPPPFWMHARHLANRRTAVPLSVGVLIAVSAVGFIALFLNLRRRRPWTALDRASAAVPLFTPAIGVAALAAGSLPVLSYAWLIPFLVIAALAGAVLGMAFRTRGPLAPAAVVSAGVIVFFVVEALRGWPDTLFPVLGGSALDGARFFGLPNTYIGVLLGAGVWLAAALPTYAGFVLLFALGLFAGFPELGADVGGALTLFAAAGLWLTLRAPRFEWRRLLIPVAVIIVGTALVFGANAWLSAAPTHATRFIEGAGQRSFTGVATERLSTSWRLLTRYPLTWIILAGLPICLWLALRPPAAMRSAYERHAEWRDAMVVLVLASIVAFVVNDTGAAAAGFGFGLAIAGILYLPLAERAAEQRP
jgi:hypothetical protein